MDALLFTCTPASGIKHSLLSFWHTFINIFQYLLVISHQITCNRSLGALLITSGPPLDVLYWDVAGDVQLYVVLKDFLSGLNLVNLVAISSK